MAATRFPVADIPGQSTGNGWDNSNIGSSVSRIGNQAAGKVGPNSLLKVMAGDLVSATTQYYYQNHSVTTGSNSSTMLDNVIASLLGAMNGGNVTSYISGKGASIGTQLAATPGFGNLATHDELDASTGPKAWLSVLFFDERFNLINENSTQIRATTANSNDVSLTLSGIKAPKNGYAYIYVSNSSDEPVYFDNFKVGHTRGRIVEEDHYYAFGLKIAGISSHKLADATGNEGHVQNNDLYNDKELFDEGDLNWYDYGFRNYDPQIGKFVQIDPLTDEYSMLSGYHYALNDPIGNVDIDALFGVNPLLQVVQCAGVVLPAAVNTARMVVTIAVNVVNAFLQDQAQKIQTNQAGQQAKQTQQMGSTEISETNNWISGAGTRKNEITKQAKKSRTQVSGIIIHQTEGSTLEGALSTGETDGNGTNFYIDNGGGKRGVDGEIVQTVPLDKTTSHILSKTHRARRRGVGDDLDNSNTIGIEFVAKFKQSVNGGVLMDRDNPKSGRGDWDKPTSKQIMSGVKLVKFLLKKYNLKKTDIYWHDQIQAKTGYEGKTILDEILKQLP